MPNMSTKDANFHATQDLIYTLQNPEPTSPLVKLGNGHKETLKNLSKTFKKYSPPAVTPRVPTREVVQEKLKEVNQEISQMKIASQSKPVTNKGPLRVPIVNSHPEEIQPVNPEKNDHFF